MTVSEKLARYVRGLHYDSIPADVQALLQTAVYNYFGCIYAGAEEAAPQVVLHMLDACAAPGKCALTGADRSAGPMDAALWCGTAANAIGFDDMYAPGIYHPGIPAITGALIACQLTRCDGKRFLEAVLAGYEIGCRIAKFINPSHYTFWHTACTVGAFAAAVAAAKVLDLSEAAFVSCLGAAGTQACGLQECTDNMAIRLHHGFAARNGVTAALLAQNGFAGPAHILEGTAGFVAATSHAEGDIAAAFADLGSTYFIRQVTFKFYPCCGHIHSCIDAVIFNMREHDLQPGQVRKIRVGSYQTAIAHNTNPAPQSAQEAKFSVEYCVAAGALYGQCTMAEFDTWPPEAALLDMMKKVELFVDEESEARFPDGKRIAVCTIETEDGAYTLRRTTRRGDPDCPLTPEEIREKFVSLVQRALTPVQTAQLAEKIARLPELPDASVLAGLRE